MVVVYDLYENSILVLVEIMENEILDLLNFVVVVHVYVDLVVNDLSNENLNLHMVLISKIAILKDETIVEIVLVLVVLD